MPEATALCNPGNMFGLKVWGPLQPMQYMTSSFQQSLV